MHFLFPDQGYLLGGCTGLELWHLLFSLTGIPDISIELSLRNKGDWKEIWKPVPKFSQPAAPSMSSSYLNLKNST